MDLYNFLHQWTINYYVLLDIEESDSHLWLAFKFVPSRSGSKSEFTILITGFGIIEVLGPNTIHHLTFKNWSFLKKKLIKFLQGNKNSELISHLCWISEGICERAWTFHGSKFLYNRTPLQHIFSLRVIYTYLWALLMSMTFWCHYLTFWYHYQLGVEWVRFFSFWYWRRCDHTFEIPGTKLD